MVVRRRPRLLLLLTLLLLAAALRLPSAEAAVRPPAKHHRPPTRDVQPPHQARVPAAAAGLSDAKRRIATVPVFASVASRHPDFAEVVGNALEPRELQSGQAIVRAGDPGKEMFFISEVRLRLFATSGRSCGACVRLLDRFPAVVAPFCCPLGPSSIYVCPIPP